MRKRPVGFWLGGLAAALVTAWLIGEWAGPRVVAAAYRQESLEVLNRVIRGRDVHELDFYLAAWPRFWRLTIAGFSIASLLCYQAIRSRERIFSSLRGAVGDGPTVRASEYLWIGAWFGALSGIAEAMHLSIRHLAERYPRGFAWDIAMLGPLSASVTFLLLTVISLPLLGRVTRGGRIRLRPAVFAFAFVAAYGLLEASEFRLAGYSVVILCAGLAAAISRAVGSHPEGFRRVLRFSTPAIGAILIGGLGTAFLTRPAAREARALAVLPPARVDAAPNVVLITLDTVRADDLGLYGYTRGTTPNLSAWAQRGTVFDLAISTAPWTLTSHASMFTGRLPHEMTADFRIPLDDSDPTLAEVLGRRGYATAGFIANMGYASRLSGLARGFGRYEGFPRTLGRFLTLAWLPRWLVNDVIPFDVQKWAGADTSEEFGKKFGGDVTDSFLGWLDERQSRPFFAFLNYMDAHTPYIPPEPYYSMYLEPGMEVAPIHRHRGNSADEMEGQRAIYDGAIAYLDHEIGRVFEGLRSRGVLDNTLVIVTADHGEHFGERGLIGHGNSLYMPVTHVPLLVAFPERVPGGLRVADAVSLRDLPATVLDLLGDDESPFPGGSLRRFWADGPGPTHADSLVFSQVNVVPIAQPWEPSFEGPMASVVYGDLHVILDGAGEIEIWDLARDPGEEGGAGGPRPDVVELESRLRASLDSLLASG